MGEVYAAENIRTGRRVAVKLLRADTKAKSSAVKRFEQEARAAGTINSDHVTQVFDVCEDEEHGIVIVFELLEGESLIDRLKRAGPVPLDELHPFIEQVWLGLADAHKAGIIHRDLKPSNVFLERRPDGHLRAKILDFGISKVPKEMGGETLTEMGQSLGTFSFMPPEQIGKAKTVDHRADIYACATLIYQALSGQLPYHAKNILVMVDL
jgi:serine/threonine-protein kinase